MAENTLNVSLTVNGNTVSREVTTRTLLVHFLRDQLNLTGAHVGCDTTQCGACTVLVDGEPIKSCTMLTVQAAGLEVTTVEGLASGKELHPMQIAFRAEHGLQCGFCTSGMMIAGIGILKRHPDADADTIRHELKGNICRCTGYHNIVRAIQAAGKATFGGVGQ
jgi:aerobic carbon-monoxide dehydrogenase small subunit